MPFVCWYVSPAYKSPSNFLLSLFKYVTKIESNLFGRRGKAINNFKTTPKIDSDLANALLKTHCNFYFLNLTAQVKEHEPEQRLVENITWFLLELGKGFAYMGRQFVLTAGGKI
ncbi:PDDEXK nuclease domain-containing protein [Ferruginibacter sp.]